MFFPLTGINSCSLQNKRITDMADEQAAGGPQNSQDLTVSKIYQRAIVQTFQSNNLFQTLFRHMLLLNLYIGFCSVPIATDAGALSTDERSYHREN